MATSNTSTIIEGDAVILSCDVTSNPVSIISLYNMTDNELLATSDNNKLYFTITSTHCLNTGEYAFSAQNGVPDETQRVNQTLLIDVMCKYGSNYMGFARVSHSYVLTNE